ncbi:HET domain-containing protein, partial [Candidatus Bathyarchaeota archaeon]|nr:HET domain-containing protein [Candidatus Bathyarchaeota archaeon]
MDALCIVQDKEEEWNDEAIQMSEIYQGSQLTIAAAQAANTSLGCFPPDRAPKDDEMSFRKRLAGADSPPRFVHVYSGNIRYRATVDGILNTRGWTLQEQLLSRRIVVCMDTGPDWRCQAGYRMSQAGLFFEPQAMSGGGSMVPHFYNSPLDDQLTHAAWPPIVEN